MPLYQGTKVIGRFDILRSFTSLANELFYRQLPSENT